MLAIELSEHGDLDGARGRVDRVGVQVERALIREIQNGDAHDGVCLPHDRADGLFHAAPEHVLLRADRFRIVLRAECARGEKGGQERAAKGACVTSHEGSIDHRVEERLCFVER